MTNLFRNATAWLRTSHRLQHLWGIYLVSLLGTELMGIGCICGREFKDVHHSFGNDSKPIRQWNWSAWDWLDVAAGLIGCFLSLLTKAAIILIILLIRNS